MASRAPIDLAAAGLLILPKPVPERRPVSRHKRGIVLIINHRHLEHVLAEKAGEEGFVHRYEGEAA